MFRQLCFFVISTFPVFAQDVLVQGSYRTRLEAWQWFEGNANNDYAFSGNILRLSLSQRLSNFEWQIEAAAPFFLGLPDDAVAAGNQGQLGLGATYFVSNKRERNAGMVFPKQAFLRLRGLFGDKTQSLRTGRFEFSDGAEVAPADPTLAAVKRDRISQRLIGPFGWSHVGRSFDGAHYVLARGSTDLTVMAGLPTRGAFQSDGWGNLKVGVVYAALTRQLKHKSSNGEWRAFGIYYDDWRNVAKVDSRPAAVRNLDREKIRLATIGGHYLHSANTSAGNFDGMFWGVLQVGRWGHLDQLSNAYAFEAGWQPNTPRRLHPWIRAGYSRTSGDDDPFDKENGTFFQILPTPRPYARFPFFNMMNNEDAFAELLLRPTKALSIRTQVHSIKLTEGNDLWYLGGGAFQPWTFGFQGRTTTGRNGLAALYDVNADYNVNAHIAVSGYFGRAIGGEVMRTVYPQGKNANFAYAELTYKL